MTATELFIYFFNNCSLATRRKIYIGFRNNKKEYLRLIDLVKKRLLSPGTIGFIPIVDFDNNRSVDKFLIETNITLYNYMDFFLANSAELTSIEFVKAIKEWGRFLRKNVKKKIYTHFSEGQLDKMIFTIWEE